MLSLSQDTLLVVIANALYYNAPLALQALQQQGATQSLFGLWFSMIFASKKSGKPKHFRRMHDKKVGAGSLWVQSRWQWRHQSLPTQ